LTREAWFIQRALLVSLILHVFLLALFFTLPGGGPAEPVQIYTVRIMEAPARPEAHALTLSTDAISALKLESPSLSPDAPPLPQPAQEDVPDVEQLPQTAATPQAGLPPSAAPSMTPPAPSATPAAPAAQPPSGALPALPGLPPQAPPTAAPGRPPSAQSPGAQVLAPPPPSLPADDASRPTALQQLGSKVRSLQLEVQTAPPGAQRPTPVPGAERNVLSLRMYSNRVREAVKEHYTFPGAFDASLRTRVRVELNRDGTVRSAEILESSGNERFDRLVCLAAFHKAEIPPIPRGIAAERNSLTLYFTCSP